MSRPIIKIHNLETDEVIEREMNDDEFAIYELDLAKSQAEIQAKIDAENAREALLTRLGITEEEAKLLLG